METDSPVVYHGTSESRFPEARQHKPQLQLSPEEIRTLRECNRESFYFRCLPYAAAGVAATFLAVKQGYLKSHPRWGAAGKMTGAAFLGWLLGKFSYRKACEDKFLKLEHSAVADAIRKKRGYTLESFDNEKFQKPYEEDLSIKDDPSYSNKRNDDYYSSSGSLNLDTDKNVPYSGLDDRDRPTTDNESYDFKDENKPLNSDTTYEELRRRNRDNYEMQQNRPLSTRSGLPSPPIGGPRQWGEREEQSKQYNTGSYEGSTKSNYSDTWGNPRYS